MQIVGAKITNGKALEKALVQAFETWAKEDINEAHWEDQFRDMDKWGHSPLTIRANGEEVGSPRDIYDLGNLYQSGVDSFTLQSSSKAVEARWHWDARNRSGEEYAIYVHEGEGTNYPYPRSFTDAISEPRAFWLRAPGRALKLQVQAALDKLSQ